MATMVSVQQIPGSDSSSHSLTTEENEEEGEDIGDLVDIPSPAKKTKKKLLRQGSVSENFFAAKGAALILPRQSSFAQSMEVMQVKKFGGDLQTHLYAIVNHIRPQDSIKLAVRLESWTESRVRYLVIVSTIGRQDTEESIIIGMDFQTRSSTDCTIGMVIPIWSDTKIRLDGDGGFKVTGRDRTHTFKPVSVQAMWSALQAMHKCVETARINNYYYGSLFLTWTCYYESRIDSPRLCLNEWEYSEEIWSRRPDFFQEKQANRASIESKIRCKLKEVMMKMDLDQCTSRQIREALEKVIDLDLAEYKTYIDSEMLTILGQMDVASKILDYLYLGSEWNAQNDEELAEIGITHILNITMEIDNFFPDNFTYKNVRCYDVETTDLLHVWNDTWKFIKGAKRQNGKCLVHCKMGISRSAATVSAFLMKEHLWSMEKALSYVKEKRVIVQPNKGFMRQLQEYEGILKASAQRHNRLFRSRSESNLSAEHGSTGNDVKPEDSPPLSNTSTSDSVPTFDLNRRLLDLTVLPYRSAHTRPKSWSPDDAKDYYLDADDFLLPDELDEESDLDRSHMSEPHGYFTPIEPENGARARVLTTQDRRKKWKRRHTEQIFTNHTFNLDSSQSEDSVFANPGDVPVPRIDSWMISNAVVKPKPKKKVAERLSSPAAMQSMNDHLAVDADANTHSSIASPMSSPSYKITKNVSVSSLKSRFNEDSLLQVELEDKEEASSMEVGITMDSPGVEVATKPIVVKDIVAVIESPTDERAGPGRESSPDDEKGPGRERSFSENLVNVKTIVNEIESRYSTDTNLSSGSSDDVTGKENTDMSPLSAVTISRSQSLPARRKKPPLSPPLQVLPVIEDKQMDSDSSPLKSLDKNMNVNNNNNFSDDFTTTVIEIESDPQNHESSILKTVSQPGCCITERIPHSAIVTPTESSAEDLRSKFAVRTLTQSELQVIREVGKTFLSDSDETNSILSSENSSSVDVVPGGSTDNPEMPGMKRGVVRRMARIIENKLKEDQGSLPKPQESHPDPTPPHTSTIVSPSTDSTTVINKLLMGEVTHPSPTMEEIDPVVKSGPSKESDPDTEATDTTEAPAPTVHNSASTNSLKDLLSLVGPTPYSPAHTSLASNNEELLDKMSSKIIRPSSRRPKGIRRTQSERSITRPIKMLFQGSRVKQATLRQTSTSKSHPELFGDDPQETDSSKGADEPPKLFYPVKEIVENIERSGRKEVARASSFYDSRTSPGRWSGGDMSLQTPESSQKLDNMLSRSQSNPHILSDPSNSKDTPKRPPWYFAKKRLRKKTDQARFRTPNPIYNTM